MQDPDFDPFAELQLSPGAEPELVKAAFKALAKKYHPDRFNDPVQKAEAEQRMVRLNEAQDMILSGTYEPRVPVVAPPSPAPPASRAPVRPQWDPPQQAGPNSISKLPFLVATLFLILAFSVPRLMAEDHLKKALSLEADGQVTESLAEMNLAVKEDPHNRALYEHRARLWEKLGQPDKAAVDRKNAQQPTLTFPSEDPTPHQVPEATPKNSATHVPRT